MATKPNQQWAAKAAPTFDLAATVGQKVVRLPSAAGRKVQQRWNKKTRPVAMALREQWPGRYIYPTIRRQMKTAELIDSVSATPALHLSLTILSVLSDEQRALVTALLAVGAEVRGGTFAQAYALIPKRMTVGEEVDLDAALRIIRGEV